jgi:mannose-1-phosphate guanylyltransferase/mannose-6-phosphate isomerase
MRDRGVVPVVLSGGSGTRLWPMSREHYPKQLLALAGAGETMLQATLLRVGGLTGLQPPVVVCNEQHRFLVAEQLRTLDGSDGLRVDPQIILEPVGRNTAPAIALAAYAAIQKHQACDPLLLVLPADHVITDEQSFRSAVLAALSLAEEGRFVTFGVVPRAPETGYGYIVRGDMLESPARVAYAISRFVEKPSRSIAENLISTGSAYWNSGMFLFSASRYLAALTIHAPDVASSVAKSWLGSISEGDFIRPDPLAFSSCRSDSIDYAVMEKVDNAAVVPLEAGWSDVGSWSSLHETLPQDPDGNALRGDVIAEDTTNTLVLSESRLVATIGLRGYVVIETKDAVLVAPKDRVQDVKGIVARLRAEERSEHSLHREVHRPWGSYDSVEQGPGYQVKRLTLKPGAAISLQLHQHRSEHWVVVSGQARITRGDESFILSANQSTYIPAGTRHRMENIADEPLQVIEVQAGDYLGEDDIVRFEDRYGRKVGAT